MKITPGSLSFRFRRSLAGFSLVEVLIGMGILATALGALFSGFTTGFFTMQLARENLRATQIMLEKVETIRLYNWDQVANTPGYIPLGFTNYYDPMAPAGQQGIAYIGHISIDPVPATPATGFSPAPNYLNNMKMLTVTLDWSTGHMPRHRQFTSYVSRRGLQAYVNK